MGLLDDVSAGLREWRSVLDETRVRMRDRYDRTGRAPWDDDGDDEPEEPDGPVR